MRHSRASINAQYMTEAVLCRFMGWSIGSKMVRVYYHGSSRQVRDVQCLHYNLATEKKIVIPSTCPRCRFTNEPDKRYCGRCGSALTVAIALSDEKNKSAAIDEAMKVFTVLMNNPEMRKRFEEYQEKNRDKEKDLEV